MPPLIPFEFDPPSADYKEAHLTYQDVPNGQQVSWPVVGASAQTHSVDSQEPGNVQCWADGSDSMCNRQR
jgi:hypothetical protein